MNEYLNLYYAGDTTEKKILKGFLEMRDFFGIFSFFRDSKEKIRVYSEYLNNSEFKENVNHKALDYVIPLAERRCYFQKL